MENTIMPASIPVSAIHHLALVVTDLQRSTTFYQEILGFNPLIDMGTRVITSNGNIILALTLPSAPGEKPANDRFDENRVGIDHLSFSISSHAEMENAVRVLDAKGISHGEIKDLGPALPLYVLAFRDPDNIQLELTAPHG
jgi:catechol 2,3-dioxygenase-like lactoylglutathione lyase family enzyme